MVVGGFNLWLRWYSLMYLNCFCEMHLRRYHLRHNHFKSLNSFYLAKVLAQRKKKASVSPDRPIIHIYVQKPPGGAGKPQRVLYHLGINAENRRIFRSLSLASERDTATDIYWGQEKGNSVTEMSSSTHIPVSTENRSRMERANSFCMDVLDSIQSYLVEAAYFMFFLARHMTLPLFQEYVQSEIHRQHHLNPAIQDIDALAANETQAYHDAQQETTVTVLSLQIAEGLPAVISVIILGALSDRTGRRRIMLWLPALGSCIYCMIFIMILYTGWTLDGLFMASAVRGLCGSMTAFLAGGSFYAINIVKPHQRSSRLALQELLNGAAYAVGNLMVGYWVKASGFVQPFWFCFICSLISLFISLVLVRELPTNRSPSRRTVTGNCCIDTFRPMAKFFKCSNNVNLVRIWLAILAFQTYAIVHIGQINTMVLYLLGPPMAWPSTKIGVFLSVAMVCAALSTGMVPPFLRNYLSDTQIAFAGFLSKAIGTLWIAVVQNETVIYFGILLLVLELLPFPMMRAIVAKGIDPADQGSLFALMHSGESISYFVAPLMFQSIYASTLHYYSGFVFVIAVVMLVLPVAFTIGIRYIDLRDPAEYETMGGESELVSNEMVNVLDGAQPHTISGAADRETARNSLPTSRRVEPVDV